MLSSLYPMLAFAFDLLNFISSLLAVWPFLIFAMVWVVLVYLVVKALRVLRGKSWLGPTSRTTDEQLTSNTRFQADSWDIWQGFPLSYIRQEYSCSLHIGY